MRVGYASGEVPFASWSGERMATTTPMEPRLSLPPTRGSSLKSQMSSSSQQGFLSGSPRVPSQLLLLGKTTSASPPSQNVKFVTAALQLPRLVRTARCPVRTGVKPSASTKNWVVPELSSRRNARTMPLGQLALLHATPSEVLSQLETASRRVWLLQRVMRFCSPPAAAVPLPSLLSKPV